MSSSPVSVRALFYITLLSFPEGTRACRAHIPHTAPSMTSFGQAIILYKGCTSDSITFAQCLQDSILDLKFGGEAIRFKAEIGQYTRGRGVYPHPMVMKAVLPWCGQIGRNITSTLKSVNNSPNCSFSNVQTGCYLLNGAIVDKSLPYHSPPEINMIGLCTTRLTHGSLNSYS